MGTDRLVLRLAIIRAAGSALSSHDPLGPADERMPWDGENLVAGDAWWAGMMMGCLPLSS